MYAHVQGFAQHERARAWLDERLNGTARVGLPWPSLLAFLRLVTDPRIFERPASMRAAWQQVEEWLDCEAAWVPAPTDRHRHVLGRLLGEGAVRANLVPDAHLAALRSSTGWCSLRPTETSRASRSFASRIRSPVLPRPERRRGES